jgi:secreted trypsin-like serine protease
MFTGKSACVGDSGGGFAMIRGGRWYLRGVVSFGISKTSDSDAVEARMCDKDYPSLYADITSGMEWLLQALREKKLTVN